MLENSYYSVISPEGCAAILWKHRKHAPEAAAALKLTGGDLKELGLVDEVVPEPMGGAHQDQSAAVLNLRNAVCRELDKLVALPTEELLETRYAKFRKVGEFALV
jgi:acetyl-CoA carboxylase carboxyl transferase subunit alpha